MPRCPRLLRNHRGRRLGPARRPPRNPPCGRFRRAATQRWSASRGSTDGRRPHGGCMFVISSVMRTADRRVRVLYVAEGQGADPESPDPFRLVAAVVWPRPHRHPRLARQTPRALFRWYRRALALRRIGVPAVRGSGFGPGAGQETTYDAVRRTVDIRGRAFTLPPEQRTLVLLAAQSSDPARDPDVKVRTVPAVVLSLGALLPERLLYEPSAAQRQTCSSSARTPKRPLLPRPRIGTATARGRHIRYGRQRFPPTPTSGRSFRVASSHRRP